MYIVINPVSVFELCCVEDFFQVWLRPQLYPSLDESIRSSETQASSMSLTKLSTNFCVNFK